MEYTYFNNIDDAVFSILRLHENPCIRDKYMKKVFQIDIKNLPSLKKGDVIQLVKEHPNDVTTIDGDYKFTKYSYTEKYRVKVIKITRSGKIFVRFYGWYEYTMLEAIKSFICKLKYKLIDRLSYSFSEKDNYDFRKEDEATEEIERYLGLK